MVIWCSHSISCSVKASPWPQKPSCCNEKSPDESEHIPVQNYACTAVPVRRGTAPRAVEYHPVINGKPNDTWKVFMEYDTWKVPMEYDSWNVSMEYTYPKNRIAGVSASAPSTEWVYHSIRKFKGRQWVFILITKFSLAVVFRTVNDICQKRYADFRFALKV